MSPDKPPQNHYQVLGLERSTDERAIKKAYFTLIRQFSPDKHPEEFRRIREAYEVLSDPVARKRYDGSEENFSEYGPEVGATLREVVAAGRAGDEELARQKLTALLEQHPEVHTARHLLGITHLHAKEFDKALEVYTQLTTELPDNVLYALHLGYALSALERPAEALAAFEKAYELKPADVAAALALAGALAQKERATDALELLAQSLTHHQELGPARLALELRRIAIMGGAGQHETMHSEAAKLVELAGGAGDLEMSRYLSGELAGVAAKLFADKQHDAANELLTLCEKLRPDSPVEHPWHTTTVEVAELPERTRKWLAGLHGGAQSPTLEHSSWWWPLIGSLVSAAALVVVALLLWDEPQPTTVERLLGTLLGLGMVAGLGMMTVRAVHSLISSGIRHCTTVTLLHLWSVTPRRVQVFPLFTLDQVRVVKHTTNGAYTHTQVHFQFFEGKHFFVSIRDEGYATAWARYVLESRQRALELLLEGFLDAESDAELIPLALLKDAGNKPLLSAADRRWWIGATAVAVAGTLLSIPINAQKVDAADFERALRAETPASLRAYMQSHPGSSHARQIHELQVARFDAGLTALADACAPESEPCMALANALRGLRESLEPQVALTLTTELQASAEAAVPAAMLKETERAATEQLARRLTGTLQAAGAAAVEVVAGKSAPVTISLQRRLSVEGTLSAKGTAPVTRLLSTWSARLTTAKGDRELPLHLPPASAVPVRAAPTEAAFREAALRAQLAQDTADCAVAVAEGLGLKEAALSARLSTPVNEVAPSPY